MEAIAMEVDAMHLGPLGASRILLLGQLLAQVHRDRDRDPQGQGSTGAGIHRGDPQGSTGVIHRDRDRDPQR